MILRVYTGENGQVQFEEIELPIGPDGRSPLIAAKAISFHYQKPGTYVDFHTVAERGYFINISGDGEIGSGSGEVLPSGPGQILLCEDLTGQGHSFRVIGDQPRIFVRIQLA